MRAYARRFGEDEERWAVTGLVHDLDYERYPDLDTGHPRMALEELRGRGYPDEVIDAVAGHADFLDVAARDAAREDAVRGRRAVRVRRRLRARPPDRDRGDEAEVGAQEAEAAVVRRQGRP